MAFERVYGPIDSSWRDGQLAQINVLLQQILLSWTDSSDSPIPPVMPGELYDEHKRKLERGEID